MDGTDNWSLRYVHVGVREVKWMVLGVEVSDLRFEGVVVVVVDIVYFWVVVL